MASQRAPRPGPPPNYLVEGTALQGLSRVPDYAHELWAHIHRVEGRCVRVSGLLLDRFGEAFERLGLAEVARAEIDRHAGAVFPPGSIVLRYHAVALFEHLGRIVKALSTLVREWLEVDALEGSEASLTSPSLIEQISMKEPDLGRALERRRAGLLRIERLEKEAGRPAGLRFAPEELAKVWPAGGSDPGEVDVSELGVGPMEGAAARREWLPIGELALAMVADSAGLVEEVARMAMGRVEGGGKLELDMRIEIG